MVVIHIGNEAWIMEALLGDWFGLYAQSTMLSFLFSYLFEVNTTCFMIGSLFAVSHDIAIYRFVSSEWLLKRLLHNKWCIYVNMTYMELCGVMVRHSACKSGGCEFKSSCPLFCLWRTKIIFFNENCTKQVSFSENQLPLHFVTCDWLLLKMTTWGKLHIIDNNNLYHISIFHKSTYHANDMSGRMYISLSWLGFSWQNLKRSRKIIILKR